MATETEVVTEIERRFLVHGLTREDMERAGATWVDITQGYLGTAMRVRTTELPDEVARSEVTRKEGEGLTRTEYNTPIKPRLAELLMGGCDLKIQKRRYMLSGWEIDFFEGPLEGLVLAEYEMDTEGQEVPIPEWLESHLVKDVTNSLTNYRLALISKQREELRHASAHEDVERYMRPVPRIAITGAPVSGKSTILKMIEEKFPGTFHVVPEAATIAFETIGVTRPDPEDGRANAEFQRQLARLQRQLEDMAAAEVHDHGKRMLLTDRGLLDNAAYLEGGIKELAAILGIDVVRAANERYDAVFILAPPPKEIFEAKKRNNPARNENNYEEIVALGDRIYNAWIHHDNPHFVNGETWEGKVEALFSKLRQLLDQMSHKTLNL